MSGHREIAKLLIEKGSEIIIDDESWKQILAAQPSEQKTMLKRLIEIHGGTLETRSNIKAQNEGGPFRRALYKINSLNQITDKKSKMLGQQQIDGWLKGTYLQLLPYDLRESLLRNILLHDSVISGIIDKESTQKPLSLVQLFILIGATDLLRDCKFGMKSAAQKRAKEKLISFNESLIEILSSDTLHWAVLNEDQKILEFLGKTVNVDAIDEKERTALHLAAGLNRSNFVEFLISKSAKIDAKDSDGWTALHWAVNTDGDAQSVVRLLIPKGAQVNDKDTKGRTPLHWVVNPGSPTTYSLSWYRRNVAQYLIENGADINMKDKKGRTALHLAAMSGHLDLVALLIAKGAKVNITDAFGGTPLYFAAQQGHLGTAKLLIEKGAQINVKNAYGRTPFHAALKWANKETLELLISAGADLVAKDTFGRTPFHAMMILPETLLRYLQVHRVKVVLSPNIQSWFGNYCRLGSWFCNPESVNAFLLGCLVDQEKQNNKPLLEKTQDAPSIPTVVFETPLMEEDSYFSENYNQEFIAGLALDGEGLQALITASMIKRLEEEMKCPLFKLFDHIAGSGLAGTLALGLVASREGNCPLLEIKDLLLLFDKYGTDVYPLKVENKSKQRRALGTLRKKLGALFRGTRLSDSLTRVLVPCIKVQSKQPFDFDSEEAQKRIERDYYIRDVACITAVDNSELFFFDANEGLLGTLMASGEYKSKAADLLFQKLYPEKEKLHLLYCASNTLDEIHNRSHQKLTRELNAQETRYCRIKPEDDPLNISDPKDVLTLYKEKGEAAAEKFLIHNEAFIRKLQENRARKDKAEL